ncbi:MAG: TonB-dependent receptor [Chryseolinea sp.]
MLRSVFLSLVALIASTAFVSAQGSISGTITDAVTGEAIIGANVLIKDTSIGSTTDIEGNFTISKVSAGTYTLQISSVTYKTHIIENLIVEDAKKVTLTIAMHEDVSELEEVVVQAQRLTNTDFALMQSIKEAKLVVSGVTAEQISKSLDRDAAQVLRRVPGVTIKDNQFVQIRGLSERYNPVMLHNAYAPSLETDVRSFSFAMIPSSQLDRMLVFKSASADLPGDFAGGVVKVFTKSIPEENSVILDYSTQIRVGTTFNDYYYQQKNNNHFTGFNNGFYDLPSTFPKKVGDVQGDALVTAGQSLKNLWTPEKGKAMPDQRFTLTLNRKFKIGSVEVGNISAINYSNSYATYEVQRGDYTESGNIDVNNEYKDKQYNQLIRTGFLFNWAFQLNPNHTIEFKNLYNQSSQDQYINRTGVGDASIGRNGEGFDKYYRGIYSGQLLGTHHLFNKSTTVEWMMSYNNSYRDQPDYKRYITNQGASGNPEIQIANTVLPNQLGRFYSKLNEDSYSGGASIVQRFGSKNNPLKSPELKAGFFFENKSRTFNARNIGYSRSAGFDESLQSLTAGQLFQPENINNTTGIILGEITKLQDSYTASNNLLAYYLMASVPFAEKFKLDAGARVENNLQKLYGYELDGSHSDVYNQINKLLPSTNLSYNFTEKMLVRAAYSQTLNRPEFRELAAFSYFDFNYNFLWRGNKNLRTATIQNVDLRWELYPSKAESISIGTFYKYFADPIETLVDNNSSGGGTKQIFFKNAEYAKSLGVEIEVKKSLDGLTNSHFVDNISVMLNATFIKSTVKLYDKDTVDRLATRPMQGQAPYVINTGIFYNSNETGWQVNLLYNVVGKNIAFVGSKSYKDVYQMPRNLLDLTFSKQINERFQLKGGVTDILNQPIQFLQDGNGDGTFDRKKDQTVQKYKPGQVFSIGFTWKVM